MSSETYHRGTLPVGALVEYHSRSQNQWIPATVCAVSLADGRLSYVLDVQPCAPAERVRARQAPSSTVMAALLQLGFSSSDAKAASDRCSSVEAAVEFLSSEANEEVSSARHVQCPLCLEERPFDGIISLDCDHKFCADCFREYCESKIREGQVAEDEFVCPGRTDDMKLCGQTITVDQARGAVTAEGFVRFLEFRARLWEPTDGLLVACPQPDCCRFVVAPGTAILSCPRCRQDLCPRCFQLLHEGPCDMGERAELEEMIAAHAWQRCPVCRAPTELEAGCYFMKCPSERCRGKVHFCYLCGEQLNEEDHAFGRSLVHFPRGPYNCECINVTEEQYRQRGGNDRPEEVEDLQAGIRRLLEI